MSKVVNSYKWKSLNSLKIYAEGANRQRDRMLNMTDIPGHVNKKTLELYYFLYSQQCKIDLYNCFKAGEKGKLECLRGYKTYMSVFIPTIGHFRIEKRTGIECVKLI